MNKHMKDLLKAAQLISEECSKGGCDNCVFNDPEKIHWRCDFSFNPSEINFNSLQRRMELKEKEGGNNGT